MEFRLLGNLEVSVDGSPVDVGGTQPRTVLAMLLVAGGRVVPAESIVEALWGHSPPDSAAGTLQSYVSRLRRVLVPNGARGEAAKLLAWDPPGYKLVVGGQGARHPAVRGAGRPGPGPAAGGRLRVGPRHARRGPGPVAGTGAAGVRPPRLRLGDRGPARGAQAGGDRGPCRRRPPPRPPRRRGRRAGRAGGRPPAARAAPPPHGAGPVPGGPPGRGAAHPRRRPAHAAQPARHRPRPPAGRAGVGHPQPGPGPRPARVALACRRGRAPHRSVVSHRGYPR